MNHPDTRRVKIADYQTCCGCSACEQICPRGCITMQENSEGFLYPNVDETRCIDCGLCEKACPDRFPYAKRKPLKTLAAINRQEITRLKSSSGGIFSLLAENCIAHGGTVFGARFTPTWCVEHKGTNVSEDIPHYRGSKYVQSKIGHCFTEVKELLEKNKRVMFVGTPCQVAGLHHYLGKSFEDLLTVDFICHGVSSPAVWKWYINDVAKSLVGKSWLNRIIYAKDPLRAVRNVEFRNKEYGWKQFHTVIDVGYIQKNRFSVIHYENPYMRSFLTNLNLRLSCYQCSSKAGRSHSDITLADFWNVHKVVDGYDDDKGTSLILINTEKGAKAFSEIGCKNQEVDFEDAIQYNQAWHTPFAEPERRKEFFQKYTTHFKDFI